MDVRYNINTIKNVYEKVAVYNRLKDDYKLDMESDIKFDSLPIIEKKYLLNRMSSCIMPEYYMDYVSNKLMRIRTSGSTGQYLEILWNSADYMRSMVELWLLRAKFYNIYPHNRLCYFFTDNQTSEYYISEKNQLGISKLLLNGEGLEKVYEAIIQWEPEWMILQPSMAVILCQYIKGNSLDKPKSLRYIEFTGELLTEDVRELTNEVLGCVISNQYGCQEVNSIALECPYGNMHIMNTNVFIEIADEQDKVINNSLDMLGDSDEEGRIIITSLQNKVMPFIRYDIGDRGRMLKSDCKCGCKGKVLELLTGRNNDYVLLENGERISAYVFVRIFDRVNAYTDGAIIQFFVEQVSLKEFNIQLCIDDMDEEYIVDCFYSYIDEKRLAGSKFNFEFTTGIFEVRGNGKHMYFKSWG